MSGREEESRSRNKKEEMGQRQKCKQKKNTGPKVAI